MTGEEQFGRAYVVSVRQADEAAALYRVSYAPRGMQHYRTPGKPTKKVPEYTALVNALKEGVPVIWETAPADPEVDQQAFERDARRRAKLVHHWLSLLSSLIASVQGCPIPGREKL